VDIVEMWKTSAGQDPHVNPGGTSTPAEPKTILLKKTQNPQDKQPPSSPESA